LYAENSIFLKIDEYNAALRHQIINHENNARFFLLFPEIERALVLKI